MGTIKIILVVILIIICILLLSLAVWLFVELSKQISTTPQKTDYNFTVTVQTDTNIKITNTDFNKDLLPLLNNTEKLQFDFNLLLYLTELAKENKASCQEYLSDKNKQNSCNNISNKTKCVVELVAEIKNTECCCLLFEDTKTLSNPVAKNIMQCVTNYAIENKKPLSCTHAPYKKECFQCLFRSTKEDISKTELCNVFVGNNKEICKTGVYLSNSYCTNIKDENTKKECELISFTPINCQIYTNNEYAYAQKSKYPELTTPKEVQSKTLTNLAFSKKIPIPKDEFIKNAGKKIYVDYNLKLPVSTKTEGTLEPCTSKKPKTDYDNSGHSTFYFDYKDYHFVYSLKMFYDLLLYSSEIKEQHCHEFEKGKSYERYLKDKYNNAVIDKIVEDFNNLKESGFTNDEIFEIVVRFVQEIPYNYLVGPTSNFYPYETLWRMRGVCGDKSTLLVLILSKLGYEIYIMDGKLDAVGSIPHEAVGVPCDNGTIMINNKNICYIETTFPYFVGDGQMAQIETVSKVSDGKKYTEAEYGPKKMQEYKKAQKKMDELIIEINSKLNNFQNTQEYVETYNKLVEQYNNYLYESAKIKFEVYE